MKCCRPCEPFNSSYVSVGKMTLAKRGEKSVPIKGLTDKRNVTMIFAVTFIGDFFAHAYHLRRQNRSQSAERRCLPKRVPCRPK